MIYYPVGGGIVWDSIPEKEYEETITKARNLFITLGIKDEEIRNINI
jgi:anthranilate/para-aminobenzoate synthase component I